MGSSTVLSSSGNITLPLDKRVIELNESVVNLNYDATLPDARNMQRGGPHFILTHNTSSTGVCTIKDNAGGTVVALTNQQLMLNLIDNSTQAGEWAYVLI